VQASDDADFFGVKGVRTDLSYFYSSDDLPAVEEGLTKCEKELGSLIKELDKFFDERDFYSDKDVAKEVNIRLEDTKEVLVWYARYRLGLKIKNCIETQGYCGFSAEM
jgi:hypothetical protein